MPAPIPWMAIATLGSTLLPMLFGGKGKQRQETTQMVPPRGYQSPMLGLMDPLIMEMLMKNMKYMQSSRLPGGGRFGTGSVDKILGLLGGQWDKLLAGYNRPSGIPGGIRPATRGGMG